MARIFSGKSFVRKDVAQMGSALGAENLRTASVGIRFAAHGTRNFIIEAGPAAAGIEFILRTVQRSTAPAAAIIRKSKCSTDFKRNDFLKKNEAYPLGALRSLKFAYRKLRISLFVELAV